MEIFVYFCNFFVIILYANGFTSNLGALVRNEDPWQYSFKPVPLKLDKVVDRNILPSNLHQKGLAWKWPLGVINYYVDISSYDYLIVHRIRMTMNILEASSCIKFAPILVKPTEGNSSWLHITNPDRQRDCVHEPWYKEHGEVRVVLGYDCLHNVDVLHALLHGIGFMDEVTHPQRDKYIRVLWNNIQPGYRHLFYVKEGFHSSLEYDPLSVMHFHDRDFTVNGHATIEPAVTGLMINPSHSLSQLDKLRLRLLFGHACNNREVVKLMKTCQNTLLKSVKENTENNSQEKKRPEQEVLDNTSSDEQNKESKRNVTSIEENEKNNKQEDDNQNLLSLEEKDDKKDPDKDENKNSADAENNESNEEKMEKNENKEGNSGQDEQPTQTKEGKNSTTLSNGR